MGEVVAVAVSFCWSFTSIQLTLASQRIGSEVVNRARLALAVLCLSIAHLLLHGAVWPIQAEPFRWAWLGLSGTIGLVVGDACLFQAFVYIGPRRSMLLMTLVPVIGALLAWTWLGETLQPLEIAAVLLTVGGIAWVVLEGRAGQADGAPTGSGRPYALGVLLGLGGAFGQALGLVTAKQGMAGDFPALSATVIRMVIATGVVWLLALVRGRVGKAWQALKDRKTRLWLAGGSLTGPVIGVWLSMVAVQSAQVGIASTLMSLSPIIMIPLERRVFHSHISPRSVVGTVVALAGASIILLT